MIVHDYMSFESTIYSGREIIDNNVGIDFGVELNTHKPWNEYKICSRKKGAHEKVHSH
jgi:hypothetical protein